MKKFSDLINELIENDFTIENIDICMKRLYVMVGFKENVFSYWHIRIHCNPDLLTINHYSKLRNDNRKQYKIIKNI